MGIHQALEEYIRVPKNLPMIPYFLRMSLSSCRQIPLKIPTRSANTKNTDHLDSNTPVKNTESNNKTPHTLNDKDFACVPIVTNGKYMGVIVAEEECRGHDSSLRPNKYPSTGHEVISDAIPVDTVKKVLHEVNTPLGIIKNYLHVLGSKLSNHDIAQDEIRIIHEEINRISTLLEQLNTCSPAGECPKPEEAVDINAQLDDIFQIMAEALNKHNRIELKLNLDQDLPMIQASKSDIKQIFVNLIKNSMDAMPDGGDLIIQTKYVRPPDGSTGPTSREPNERLEIIVTDNGLGVPLDIAPRIFEPFISSKEDSHSGLGLSIVQEIVASLDGTIKYIHNKNKGATFKISLPLQAPVVFASEVFA